MWKEKAWALECLFIWDIIVTRETNQGMNQLQTLFLTINFGVCSIIGQKLKQ